MEQFNHITKESYKGMNQVNLQGAKRQREFESDEWLTFLQAKEKGLKIKKGSKGVSILSPFINGEKNVKNEKGEDVKVEYHLPRHYTVFNLDQTEQ